MEGHLEGTVEALRSISCDSSHSRLLQDANLTRSLKQLASQINVMEHRAAASDAAEFATLLPAQGGSTLLLPLNPETATIEYIDTARTVNAAVLERRFESADAAYEFARSVDDPQLRGPLLAGVSVLADLSHERRLWALNNFGFELFQSGDFASARQVLTEVITAAADVQHGTFVAEVLGNAFNTRGWAALETDDLSSAGADFGHALAYGNDNGALGLEQIRAMQPDA